MHIFHKWERFEHIRDSEFLGERIEIKYYDEFRRCVKCGIIQEYFYDSQGGSWETLDKQKTEIFNRKLVKEYVPESRVVCAANKLKSGLIIAGARHFDKIMRDQVDAIGVKMRGSEQGFIDQFGNFLTRKEAMDIAKKQEQLYRRFHADKHGLFSENLY